ncbi:ThuA domain-containing protein [Humisphaera borealis]|uniref:ThuA domain-containing protein n=1 Tax=Humisphaera borealis TaxID=2807512 RepID=A0A7M2WUC6_9BACT|nr:ThuA domain-containing protein [Humisphaera borealis]QOV88874.1 ThuA domain-containing protein [Humisphaera borealis]
MNQPKTTSNLSRRRFLTGVAATAAAAVAFPHLAFGQAKKRKLVMIAGKPSHPAGMHEFNAGVYVLSQCLKAVPDLEVSVHRNHWVSDEKVLDDADALFIYSDGRQGHPAVQGDHKEKVAKLMARGVGLMCAHYAVEVDPKQAGDEFKAWIGGHYEHEFSVNPIWEPKFETFPNHPISRGVKPFTAKDEWYFNMRFRPEMKGVTSILTATPSDAVRDGPYVYPKGPYKHIQEAKGRVETMMWAVEREDGGRGVGFTGGHFHTNWGIDDFRKVVLNALLWISKVEVPANGLESKLPEGELLKNLDPKAAPKK